MLTVEKLKIYEKFGGDIDGWARMSRGRDPSGMTDADWYLIDELLTGLAVAAAGSASSSFSQHVEARMHASTADGAARDALRAIATRQRSNSPRKSE